ncbi:acetyl-CoA carboxylase, biotin carboxyl carrier protein [Brevibacillus reuszeri]|uniref:Biotin carboxyl carrier protein of acetyl-CoA carboxylase n=1 Tax=Brevibacillus reuszeri TaxID=54915 RepID=A0A0K9YRS5_9BACL|nr:acetyl-CoA carboxylase biotin carboxyl carrier protein [Brevibacillus reuszeri]KNB70890.1 acetyl-CoA carboxylase [Brevibacillus reuszeri]MED1857289.1 acetyl-CoA carboxylase biotin carboxyl carrier protein [Brevibacillus reuszeri]GED66883.1 acetyl-CoA carboxylase, biotin carboxyl carrier protein [Brevibacillus reuszeri]
MLTIYELRELVKLLEQTDVESFEVKNEDSHLSIKRRLGEQTIVVQAPVSQPKLAVVPSVAPPQTAAKTEQTSPAVTPSQPPVQKIEETENLYQIISPMVGTFYTAPAVDAPPYISVGDQVQPATIVCIVEAMKLFNEIEAEVKGKIVKVLVENGQLVDQGQPLFLVKRA